MKTYFISGLKNSSNQMLKPYTFEGLEEGSDNKPEPLIQNGTKSLPSLGNNIPLKIENINFHI